MTAPAHRSEQTGNPGLDRIQNNVRALSAYVRSLVWLTRRAYVELATDQLLATSATFATLLTTTITTDRASSFLVVNFAASGIKLTGAGTAYFKIIVDGTAYKAVAVGVALNFRFCAALLQRIAVSAGLHTVRIDWRTDVSSVGIGAATVTEENAALSVHEEAA